MSERRPDRKGKSWKDNRTRKIKEERTLEVADIDILHLQGFQGAVPLLGLLELSGLHGN